jgi:phenylacetic acid degradation operon negative regulatory protein
MRRPHPRGVILKLLLAAEGNEMSAREAVAACALFGIGENSARVALVRLASAQMIEARARGTYRLGPKATRLASEVATWRRAEERVRIWRGDWLAAHTGAMKRADRTALRARQRAFDLVGVRELERDLYLRPNNLAGGVAAMRDRLKKVDPDFDAPVFTVRDLDSARDRRARRLWNGRALNLAYAAGRRRLQEWLERASTLEPDIAARESYLIGDEAIRRIVFDPMLPDPLVDVTERRAFHETVLRFDRQGHAIWRAFLFARQRRDSAPSRPETIH